jgi:twitching motility protein PilT
MITLEKLLRTMVERGGSDLHISAGSIPRHRINGHLREIPHAEVLDPEATKNLIYSAFNQKQIARFEQDLEIDMCFDLSGVGRFRVNAYHQRGALGSAIRAIPNEIHTFDQLGVPKSVCAQLCGLNKGLVLVAGAAGSGKSTTLASMIDYCNQNRQDHIITIEDPIEFVHANKQCMVHQREVGTDTLGFGQSLRRVLRQDPDIVLIGEMRDKKTIKMVLTLAETGHLTFATLHTSDAVQTVNRIIDVFPAHQQSQVRTQLSFVLEGVLCQQLVPRVNGHGLALAAEVMLPNSAIRALIRENKCHQIQSHIQTGTHAGMCSMNQSLYHLYKQRQISWQDALAYSSDPDDLKRMAPKDAAGV